MTRTFLFSMLLLTTPAFAAGPLYVRFGAGLERTSKTTVHDVDCTSTNPPALFGCGAGNDGRSLGARGTFGDVSAFELAIGTSLAERTRVELAVGLRELDLDANANFLGAGGSQRAYADAVSHSAMLSIAYDFGSSTACLRPFVGAGVGASRNEIDAVRYEFPTIASNATTTTPGGTNTDLAWMLEGGVSMRISDSLRIDLALRYSELGEFRTEAGDARIIRPARIESIPIDRTTMNAGSGGVMLSLRYAM